MAGCLTRCVNLIATKAVPTGFNLGGIGLARERAHSYPCRSDAQEGITPAIRALIA